MKPTQKEINQGYTEANYHTSKIVFGCIVGAGILSLLAYLIERL